MLTPVDEILRRYDRVGITGWTGSGKTTLASAQNDPRVLLHTDDWMDLSWSDQPLDIIRHVKGLGVSRYLIEGCQVPRFARKARELYPDDLAWQLQAIAVLPRRAGHPLSKHQVSQGKGIDTVIEDVRLKCPDIRIIRL